MLGIVVIVILAIVSVIAIQPETPSEGERIKIETISAGCFVGDTNPDIRAVGKSIVITQPIKTSNPCYEATGTVDINGNEIEVNLDAAETRKICIQCLGEIVARVTIRDLESGIYGLKVNAPGYAAITTIIIE